LFKLYFNKKIWILINLLIYIYFHFIKIQYSINGSGDIIQIKDCPFFGDISVKKDQRTCQGIKFCEFTDQELINQEHCSVDFDSEIFQHYMQKTDDNTKETKTYMYDFTYYLNF